jgi:hypothetical protein
MVFHCIVPGRPVVSAEGFRQVDTNRWVLPIEDNKAVNEVVVFLSGALAPELGLGVYIAAPPFEEKQWHYLGCVHNSLPSALFKPRYVWTKDEATPTSAQIGLELLPLGKLAEKTPEMASSELFEVAKLIARDLVAYVSSFERMPADGMERWLRRFVERCRRQGVNWLSQHSD